MSALECLRRNEQRGTSNQVSTSLYEAKACNDRCHGCTILLKSFRCAHVRPPASSYECLFRLDRERSNILAVAYAVQESQIDRKSLSAVMGVERLVKNGDLDLDGAMRQIAQRPRNIANATGVALLKGDRLICRAAKWQYRV